jgi:hypothetical protein
MSSLVLEQEDSSDLAGTFVVGRCSLSEEGDQMVAVDAALCSEQAHSVGPVEMVLENC